ncbi:hypothetical protein LguiB_010749 [Lonicera macranthoides]
MKFCEIFLLMSLIEGLDRDVKKAEFVTSEYSEKQALLEHVTFGGVLAIGTFGFGPVTDFNEPKGYYEPEEEEDEYEDYNEENLVDYEHWNNADGGEDKDKDEGELNPLVSKAFINASLEAIDSNCAENNENISFFPRHNELGLEPASKSECDKKKKGERITLADLFSADSENVTIKKEDESNVKQEYSLKKSGPSAKDRLSFAKKLIPRVKEDSSPILKLQQLMTRMMKRKIHPDIEGKIIQKNYKEIQIMSNLLMPDFNTDGPANESLSLLQTQVVTACA